jgi:hypothetical protein
MIEKYRNILRGNGYCSPINQNTREEILNEKLVKSCIDHILYKGNYQHISSAIILHEISNHYPVVCCMERTNSARQKGNDCFIKIKLDRKEYHALASFPENGKGIHAGTLTYQDL